MGNIHKYYIFCKKIHKNLKKKTLSRHDDFVMSVRYLLQNDLRDFNFDSDLTSDPRWVFNHVDLPRIREGRLGGQVK